MKEDAQKSVFFFDVCQSVTKEVAQKEG